MCYVLCSAKSENNHFYSKCVAIQTCSITNNKWHNFILEEYQLYPISIEQYALNLKCACFWIIYKSTPYVKSSFLVIISPTLCSKFHQHSHNLVVNAHGLTKWTGTAIFTIDNIILYYVFTEDITYIYFSLEGVYISSHIILLLVFRIFGLLEWTFPWQHGAPGSSNRRVVTKNQETKIKP